MVFGFLDFNAFGFVSGVLFGVSGFNVCFGISGLFFFFCVSGFNICFGVIFDFVSGVFLVFQILMF